MKKQNVLLAGATGYLGGYILQELLSAGFETKIVVRNKQKITLDSPHLEVVEAEVTKPETLGGICSGIDVVISTIGITRQKDGLTYMDVDYKANANLIEEARASGVQKFIYVSVLNGPALRHLKICEAKELLVDYLQSSGLEYCIVRPNGFFSDMGDFLSMAKGGTVYLFGDGEGKLNPIHGQDLAEVCVNAINSDEKEINVGGPDMLTQNEIATLALKAYAKPSKIVHIPDWIRRTILFCVRAFSSSKTYGPIEFFMEAMTIDMEAPQYGVHRLEDFFNQKARQ